MTPGWIARFWVRVERRGPDECWPWLGGRNRPQATPTKSAYGMCWCHGRMVGAHRASYQLAHGPIPAGLYVLHNCDNGFCVNPGHLRVGTAKDNMADALARGRRAFQQVAA